MVSRQRDFKKVQGRQEKKSIPSLIKWILSAFSSQNGVINSVAREKLIDRKFFVS